MLTLWVGRHAKWSLRCLDVWFGVLAVQHRRGVDGCPVDDRVPLHQATGACFRGSVGDVAESAGGEQYRMMIVDDYSRMG